MAVTMNCTKFWCVTPCSLVNQTTWCHYRRPCYSVSQFVVFNKYCSGEKKTTFSRSFYMPFQIKQILPYLKTSSQTHYRLFLWTKQYFRQSVSNRLLSSPASIRTPATKSPDTKPADSCRLLCNIITVDLYHARCMAVWDKFRTKGISCYPDPGWYISWPAELVSEDIVCSCLQNLPPRLHNIAVTVSIITTDRDKTGCGL